MVSASIQNYLNRSIYPRTGKKRVQNYLYRSIYPRTGKKRVQNYLYRSIYPRKGKKRIQNYLYTVTVTPRRRVQSCYSTNNGYRLILSKNTKNYLIGHKQVASKSFRFPSKKKSLPFGIN
jgi:hypothetical protein